MQIVSCHFKKYQLYGLWKFFKFQDNITDLINFIGETVDSVYGSELFQEGFRGFDRLWEVGEREKEREIIRNIIPRILFVL